MPKLPKVKREFCVEGLGHVYSCMAGWGRTLEAFYSVGAAPFSGEDLAVARIKKGLKSDLSKYPRVIESAIVYVPYACDMLVARSPLLDLELAKEAAKAVKRHEKFLMTLTEEEVEEYRRQAEEDKSEGRPPWERRVLMLDKIGRLDNVKGGPSRSVEDRRVKFSFDEIGKRDETLFVLGNQAENYARFLREGGVRGFALLLQDKHWVNREKRAYVDRMSLCGIDLGYTGTGMACGWGPSIFNTGKKLALKKEGVEFREEVSFVRKMREARLAELAEEVEVDGGRVIVDVGEIGEAEKVNGQGTDGRDIKGQENVGGIGDVEKVEEAGRVGEVESVEEVSEPVVVESALSSREEFLEGISPEVLERLKSGDISPEKISSMLVDFVDATYRIEIGKVEGMRASGLAKLVGFDSRESNQRRASIESEYSDQVANLGVRREEALKAVFTYVGRVREERREGQKK